MNTTPTNNNYIIAGAIIIAGILISLGIFASKNPMANTGSTGGDEIIMEGEINLPEVSAVDHIRGNADAKVVMVEYSDIQCPFCQQFHTEVKAVQPTFAATDFAWVYRHFPLSQIHPHAERYAIATECVAKLKGNVVFGTFLDALIDKAAADANGVGVSDAVISATAVAQGVDAGQFNSCIADPAIKAVVTTQTSEAMSAGAQGTPYNVFVLKDELSDEQRSSLETLLGQPGSLIVSPDNKRLSVGGGMARTQLTEMINILLGKK